MGVGKVPGSHPLVSLASVIEFESFSFRCILIAMLNEIHDGGMLHSTGSPLNLESVDLSRISQVTRC